MKFPQLRPRRLRANENIRRLIREVQLTKSDFIYPLFITHGKGIKRPIPSMPGNFQFSVDMIKQEIHEISNLGIPGVLLFGIPETKDEKASGAYDSEGVIQKAIRAIKREAPEMLVITDVCLCEYMSHGHCGIVKGGEVLNDDSLELLAKTALSHAEAGADIVAPSDMMDGRVKAIRKVLDNHGFENTAIMSYSAKYASSLYGPFRDAAESAPAFGDRKTYQMDPSNIREAIKEVDMDIEEGADVIIVKPALAYLDVIKTVRDRINLPVAAYNVSGEFAMIKAAAQRGWIDERSVILEVLTSIKRAGADIIITYFAKDAARWIEGE